MPNLSDAITFSGSVMTVSSPSGEMLWQVDFDKGIYTKGSAQSTVEAPKEVVKTVKEEAKESEKAPKKTSKKTPKKTPEEKVEEGGKRKTKRRTGGSKVVNKPLVEDETPVKENKPANKDGSALLDSFMDIKE